MRVENTVSRRGVLAGAMGVAASAFLPASESLAAVLGAAPGDVDAFRVQLPDNLKALVDYHSQTAIGREDIDTFAALKTKVVMEGRYKGTDALMTFHGLDDATLSINTDLQDFPADHPGLMPTLSVFLANEGAHALQLKTGVTNQWMYEIFHGRNGIEHGLLMEMASDARMLTQVHQMLGKGMVNMAQANDVVKSSDGKMSWYAPVAEAIADGRSPQMAILGSVQSMWTPTESNIDRLHAYYLMKKNSRDVMHAAKDYFMEQAKEDDSFYKNKNKSRAAAAAMDHSASVPGFSKVMAPVAQQLARYFAQGEVARRFSPTP